MDCTDTDMFEDICSPHSKVRCEGASLLVCFGLVPGSALVALPQMAVEVFSNACSVWCYTQCVTGLYLDPKGPRLSEGSEKCRPSGPVKLEIHYVKCLLRELYRLSALTTC